MYCDVCVCVCVVVDAKARDYELPVNVAHHCRVLKQQG